MQNPTPMTCSTIVLNGSLVMGVRKGCSGLSTDTVCLDPEAAATSSCLQNASDRGKNPKLNSKKAERSEWTEK